MQSNEQWPMRRRWRGWMAFAVAATLTGVAGACDAPGGRTDYVEGDTAGATPGGMAPDSSTARMLGPDSATGMGGRTGAPAMAGDTMGARGMPAGRTDSATRAARDSGGRRAGDTTAPPDSASGVVGPPA